MEAAMRSNKAWALGIMTSTKGGGHLRGAIGKGGSDVSPEVAKRVFNIADVGAMTSYQHKAELVVWQEKYKAVIDMMGICALTSMWMDFNLYQLQEIAEFYRLVTGKEDSVDELLNVGLRVQNLERVFNLIHAGFGRKDDMPPQKLLQISVSAGSCKGQKLDLEQWNRMLDEYYTLHQWNQETGWPSKKRLLELKLGIAVEMLDQQGIQI